MVSAAAEVVEPAVVEPAVAEPDVTLHQSSGQVEGNLEGCQQVRDLGRALPCWGRHSPGDLRTIRREREREVEEEMEGPQMKAAVLQGLQMPLLFLIFFLSSNSFLMLYILCASNS